MVSLMDKVFAPKRWRRLVKVRANKARRAWMGKHRAVRAKAEDYLAELSAALRRILPPASRQTGRHP